MKRLLLTGAAGALGRAMRPRLAPLADVIRLSDIAEIADPGPNEEVMRANLGDAAAVHRLVEGCDGIVHLGGISVEDRFSRIMEANLLGVYNLYEAARAHGHPRIVFASSNHAVGFYRQDEYIDTAAPTRPDSLYGVSKCFGESMASMYHDKFGQESALVRIGSCTEKPVNHRMLASWLSFDDFARMIGCVFNAPRLGCTVIWGISDNRSRWWDASPYSWLGWKPQDNAEDWRAEVEANNPRPHPEEPLAKYQGGVFTAGPIIPEA